MFLEFTLAQYLSSVSGSSPDGDMRDTQDLVAQIKGKGRTGER